MIPRGDGTWQTNLGPSTAVTSLATMAFLARGHTPGQGLYGDNVNRAIDFVRKRKLRLETSLEESAEPTVLERIHDSFLASYLERMVASLPEKQRMIIVLRYQEDMELEEIAQVLRMNISTVKTQASRALELLRAKTEHRLKPGNENGK